MTSTPPLSESVQDYLKSIYRLQRDAERVSTNALAARLGVAAASATGMLKRLAELRLVEYEPYQGVRLTPAGEKIALEVIRHHRLLERYLTEAMGYEWDQAHVEAERLEHAISEEFEDRMSALLGDPKLDPHGNPIPTKDGAVAACSRLRLSDVPGGQAVRVERIDDEDADVLRRAAELGLTPQAELVVVRQGQDGPAVLPPQGRSGGPISVGRYLASRIYVVEE